MAYEPKVLEKTPEELWREREQELMQQMLQEAIAEERVPVELEDTLSRWIVNRRKTARGFLLGNVRMSDFSAYQWEGKGGLELWAVVQVHNGIGRVIDEIWLDNWTLQPMGEPVPVSVTSLSPEY